MTRRLRPLLVGIIVIVLSVNSTILACGPFSMEAVFIYTVHPSYPLENFARGEIGMVQPSYARSYLYVAYRYLSNAPLTGKQQKEMTQLWDERLNNPYGSSDGEWVKSWLEARQKVPGVNETKLDVFRNREKPNEYESYINCREDSFANAVATLNERIKKYGADSAAIRTWIEGQDQVFTNCSEGQHIPAPLSSNDDPLAQADRNYQIAAANFYATNFDEARKGFEAIGNDQSSPWHSSAPYLVARTLVRKASLGPEDKQASTFAEAENQLKTVIGDKKLSATHAAAHRLLDLVRLRLHPEERLHELALVLADKNYSGELKQSLWDYTILLDKALEPEDPAKATIAKEGLRTDDLTDWIATLQGNSNEDREHAISRWQKTKAVTWLVAILSKIDAKHSQAGDFVREALNVKSNSPAFASARFHAVRLLLDFGKDDEARTQLDQLLKNNRSQFDASSLNLLIGARMMAATSLSDFLSHAPRIPAALSWNDDGRETPSEASDVDERNKSLIGKPLFDNDAARILNTQMPLALLKEATKSESLPIHLRRDVAQATWIRAVLLGNFQTADELVPTLKILVPEMTAGLNDYLKAIKPEDKKFSALYTWLKFPGMEPVVDMGIGREGGLNQQDSYRDNWWCAASMAPLPEGVAEEEGIASFTSSTIHGPQFLTEAQQKLGQKEWTSLNSLGTMPNYLSKLMVQWAAQSPTDPSVPEALHLAVNATRYGCGDKETGRWSKAAFDTLHRRYPNTTWAKRTKYWFKE